MALPEDFNKIYGSTATGGLTPISDVNYAKGWEFVGSNPPTKNDFSYLQHVSDLKSQYLYKAIGGDSGAPAIGIPFFWPSSAMPNTVMTEWADMVFLKFNGAKFSATDYPVLAKVFPSLVLPEARGDFIRIWDDGRGVDSGRGLLSTQSDLMKQFTLQYYGPSAGTGTRTVFALQSNANGIYTSGISQNDGSGTAAAFNVPGGTETRPRNIAFNFLVRAK